MDRAEEDLRSRLKEIPYERELLFGKLKDKKYFSNLKKKLEIDIKERSLTPKVRIKQFSEYLERLQKEAELLRSAGTDISLANSVRLESLEYEITVNQKRLKNEEWTLNYLRHTESADIAQVIIQEKELILKGLENLSREGQRILRTLNKLDERRTGWSARKDRQKEYSEAMDEVRFLPRRRRKRIYRVLHILDLLREVKSKNISGDR